LNNNERVTMKLQQLRYLVEIVRQGLNVTDAAHALFTSQPGVSHHIRQLEEELGLRIFVRRGKRIVALTPAGEDVLAVAERILSEAENLKRIASGSRDDVGGDLVVATTYTQAHYALPGVVKRFMAMHPNVRLTIKPCSPIEAAELVRRGEATLCISTEVVAEFGELVMLAGPKWDRCVITSPGHQLLRERRLSLSSIAKYPIVTYDFAFWKHSKIRAAFEAESLRPRVVLTSTDPGIIKTYVAAGLGIGLIASIAFDSRTDRGLRLLDAGHLFTPSMTAIGIHRHSYLCGYLYDFIELVLPQITRKAIDSAMARKKRAGPPDAGRATS
jgi:LysR family cys regulon transcriptional activator